MVRLLTIGEAAKELGVSITTLRRWESQGRLVASERTKGGQRRYDLSTLRPEAVHKAPSVRKTVAYARVSSHDQKDDLERQRQVLELYCASQGWMFEIVSDLGSGMNYQKKGLRKLLEQILDGSVGRLVLTHKDRLLRFGAELVFSICEAKEVEVVIINKGYNAPNFESCRQLNSSTQGTDNSPYGRTQNLRDLSGEDATFEEDLAKDVLEIITVFSARLYGSRSRKNQKIIDGITKVVEDAQKS